MLYLVVCFKLLTILTTLSTTRSTLSTILTASPIILIARPKVPRANKESLQNKNNFVGMFAIVDSRGMISRFIYRFVDGANNLG